MENVAAPFETLKQILRQARDPDLLNDHAWTQSLFVQEALANSPQLAQSSPGQQLIGALAGLFQQLQPGTSPRCGKRLDPRWGEFGLLAALYFAPFNHGTSFPASLLDAWGRIDTAILYFVYGRCPDTLSEDEIKKYQLVGADLAYGSASTLSDWQRKGLQRFTEIILNRERFLSRTSSQPSILLEPERASLLRAGDDSGSSTARKGIPSLKTKRALWLVLALLLVAALGLGSLKASRIYASGKLVYQDVTRLQELARGPLEGNALDRALPLLESLQSDLFLFKQEARPALWLSPRLGWVPVYGNDLASAPAMVELAEHLLDASLLSLQAIHPLWNEFQSHDSPLDPAGLTALLVQAQPQLGEARTELDRALAARKTITAGHLSPRLRGVITEELDPMLRLADEGLSLAGALPGLLGAGNDGPKTYMLLAQNEDELRPTGGFITSVGNLVVHNGNIIRLDFEDSGEQEDWSHPYPPAPWQLQEYMNSQVLILRDANWFTNFPTTVLWAEYLYAYTHYHSVDGVIAFDQQFLVMLLDQLGPLEVEGAAHPITAENVIEYMRQAKKPPTGETIPANWTRKDFIGKIAASLLKQLNDGNENWSAIAGVLSRALEQRHLLLQFDNPVAAALTIERGWDNAVRPGPGDFLMVTDTNVGFNKTNAVVNVGLTYDVDLTDIRSPVGTLTLDHQNNAKKNVPCIQWDSDSITGEEWYPIDRCYWSYVRVYKQAGVQMLHATPHVIPGDWLMLGESVPARVDVLEEEIPGVQGFGTLLVVPGSKTLSTSFQFGLPPTVLSVQPATNEFTYHLKVQKQPGTLENPLTVRIHFPSQAKLKFIPSGSVIQDNGLLFATNLRTDVELDLVFTTP